MKKLIFAITLICVTLASCGGNSENTQVQSTVISQEENVHMKYKTIDATEAKHIIDSGEKCVILDVRTQEEYDDGHIKNAVLIPDFDAQKMVPKKYPNKSEKLLIYCRSGRRSANVAKMLTSMGYTNIYDFGGIQSWEYEIVN